VEVQSSDFIMCQDRRLVCLTSKSNFLFGVFGAMSEESYPIDPERSSAVGQIADLPW